MRECLLLAADFHLGREVSEWDALADGTRSHWLECPHGAVLLKPAEIQTEDAQPHVFALTDHSKPASLGAGVDVGGIPASEEAAKHACLLLAGHSPE